MAIRSPTRRGGSQGVDPDLEAGCMRYLSHSPPIDSGRLIAASGPANKPKSIGLRGYRLLPPSRAVCLRPRRAKVALTLQRPACYKPRGIRFGRLRAGGIMQVVILC